MNNSSSQDPKDSTSQRETYALAGSTTTNWFARRTAARDAAFFLPKLRSGMRLLDCGCGTGSITVGLSEVVAPGQVVAIDNREEAIESAKAHADESDVNNIRFERGDIYDLPFADGEFDAVFSHAVLEHLHEPGQALKEMYRVLQQEGVVGVRSIDTDGILLASADPLLMQSWDLTRRLIRHNGGDFQIGKHFRALLNKAGFSQVEASASYDSYGTPDMTALNADFAASTIAEIGQQWTELGWVDRDTVESMRAAWRKWGENPDAFYARPWCEAVGWKD